MMYKYTQALPMHIQTYIHTYYYIDIIMHMHVAYSYGATLCTYIQNYTMHIHVQHMYMHACSVHVYA